MVGRAILFASVGGLALTLAACEFKTASAGNPAAAPAKSCRGDAGGYRRAALSIGIAHSKARAAQRRHFGRSGRACAIAK